MVELLVVLAIIDGIAGHDFASVWRRPEVRAVVWLVWITSGRSAWAGELPFNNATD
ncbi:MAG: hypothetical protein HC898_05690 [Phycisphaerales bacterium]|nr:hypothetical protein [Phycisphaerales bacterium]